MKKINFAKLLKNYQTGWVAISSDFTKVIEWAKTLKELTEKTKNAKEKLYYFPAGESYGNFIGHTKHDNSL